MILINYLMNTQFKSKQQTTFQPYNDKQQNKKSKIGHQKGELAKMNSFGKQDININTNTNCSSGQNQYDEPSQAHYNQNSNNLTINFDKYVKMKGQSQRAKMNIGQIQFDQCQKIRHVDCQQQLESKTVPLRNFKKIHIEMTEEETIKVGNKFKSIIHQQIKNKQAAQDLNQTTKKQSKKKKNLVQPEDNNINIVKNNQVESILNKLPLRLRYSSLLQDHQKYDIGFQHRMLVKLLQVMDYTLDYLKSNRNNKATFLTNLQANFKKNNGPQLNYERIRKLLFLDDKLYELQWAIKDSSNKYDLIIRLPQFIKFQQRKKNLKTKIIHYLLAKQSQYLQSIGKKKIQEYKWVDGFDPNKYSIPQKQLPIHPHQSQISVKSLSQAQINAIPNCNLRNITQDMKRQYQKKCLKSQDVISMIFSNAQKHKFEQKLYATIRQKQIMLKEYKPPVQKITKQIIINVLIQIQYIYNSKNVTNIFRATLQQKLLKSLTKYANQSILQSLKIILQAKDILFLRQQMTSNKTQILQINRAKYEQMKARIQATY